MFRDEQIYVIGDVGHRILPLGEVPQIVWSYSVQILNVVTFQSRADICFKSGFTLDELLHKSI